MEAVEEEEEKKEGLLEKEEKPWRRRRRRRRKAYVLEKVHRCHSSNSSSDGTESEDAKQSTADITVFVQNLLVQLSACVERETVEREAARDREGRKHPHRQDMIFVDGLPFPTSDSDFPQEGKETLLSLLQHPSLVSASERLKGMGERRVSLGSEGSNAELPAAPAKHVYVFQREFATVDPGHVQLAGTDEATTCVGIVIRNQDSEMTSVAHLDSPRVVDSGLTQILSSFAHGAADALIVHLIGGFEDASFNESNDTSDEDDDEELGYSLPLCSKIIETLKNRREHFHVKTLCVLGHNTKKDSFGTACPIISGFLVDTSTGLVMPASFDRSSRCPDEIVRRVRVTVSSEDPSWKGKLLDTYDTHHDRFQIAPCSWAFDWGYVAFRLQQLSDSEILSKCSTSPLAESPDFVENERRSSHAS